jgi:hypothetical protein
VRERVRVGREEGNARPFIERERERRGRAGEEEMAAINGFNVDITTNNGERNGEGREEKWPVIGRGCGGSAAQLGRPGFVRGFGRPARARRAARCSGRTSGGVARWPLVRSVCRRPSSWEIDARGERGMEGREKRQGAAAATGRKRRRGWNAGSDDRGCWAVGRLGLG